jgi:hypothetical protein
MGARLTAELPFRQGGCRTSAFAGILGGPERHNLVPADGATMKMRDAIRLIEEDGI